MIVGAVGISVLAVGIAMIVLPGPAIIVVPLGLGILATEFVWARTILTNLKNRASRLKKGIACPSNL
jgi:tellurite resistance protein TerC